jgi:hypothetical protein
MPDGVTDPVEPPVESTTEPATEVSGDDLFGAASGDASESSAEDTPDDAAREPFDPVTDSADTVISQDAAPTPASPADRQHAWALASNWSLAAAVYAKGFDSPRYQPYLDKAGLAAATLDIDMPALPSANVEENREAAVVAALVEGGGAELVATIEERLDPAAAAAAKLAIYAHVLLLAYSPASTETSALATTIRTAGTASELPLELWQPLAELVERRADFDDVKVAVFAMQKDVAAHLSAQAPN